MKNNNLDYNKLNFVITNLGTEIMQYIINING